MTIERIKDGLRKAGVDIFRDHAGHPLPQAQRNLHGRTHYVDNETLRYFKGRINSTLIQSEGLILVVLESEKPPHSSAPRSYRFVVFDVFGTVIVRGSECRGTEAARKEMRAYLDTFDALAWTRKAMADHAEALEAQARYLRYGAE